MIIKVSRFPFSICTINFWENVLSLKKLLVAFPYISGYFYHKFWKCIKIIIIKSFNLFWTIEKSEHTVLRINWKARLIFCSRVKPCSFYDPFYISLNSGVVGVGSGLLYLALMCRKESGDPLHARETYSSDNEFLRLTTITWQGSWRERKCSSVSQPPPTRTITWRPFNS